MLFTARGPEGMFSFVLLCLGFLVWFVRNWQQEFVFLMGLRDGDFPGRHDKADLGGHAGGARADRRLVLPGVSPGPLARARSR